MNKVLGKKCHTQILSSFCVCYDAPKFNLCILDSNLQWRRRKIRVQKLQPFWHFNTRCAVNLQRKKSFLHAKARAHAAPNWSLEISAPALDTPTYTIAWDFLNCPPLKAQCISSLARSIAIALDTPRYAADWHSPQLLKRHAKWRTATVPNWSSEILALDLDTPTYTTAWYSPKFLKRHGNDSTWREGLQRVNHH